MTGFLLSVIAPTHNYNGSRTTKYFFQPLPLLAAGLPAVNCSRTIMHHLSFSSFGTHRYLHPYKAHTTTLFILPICFKVDNLIMSNYFIATNTYRLLWQFQMRQQHTGANIPPATTAGWEQQEVKVNIQQISKLASIMHIMPNFSRTEPDA